ncbi:MAG: hypothetical protein JETT_0936 [Candidatus Jettenia ecosi]|uniref:eCIS core domain-containing protein n=1 Tax=Candidatus Jettenia ecosi TaxID=2494326 RepID=A0A533QDS6_9BACT|nr:MAG: hypothetical protein JETT_0936 [Candidatus Jettenia ecosi]
MRTVAEKPKANQQTTSAKSAMSGRGYFGHSRKVKSILHLQRTLRNQAVQRLLQAKPDGLEAVSDPTASGRFGHDFSQIPVHAKAPVKIQSKLVVNTPGDIYEQEADRVSEQVMRLPVPQLQRACPCGGGCPKCQTEQSDHEYERLQTKSVQASETGQIATLPIVQEVLAVPGQPLDPASRVFMEQRFGYDFSKVRVHSGATAEQSARELNAHAYTVGCNIVFGTGKFSPETHEGQRLLAHELTHVVQQDNDNAIIQRKPAPIPVVIDASGKGIEGVISNTWSAALRESPSRTSKVLADLPRGHKVLAKSGRFWIKVQT